MNQTHRPIGGRKHFNENPTKPIPDPRLLTDPAQLVCLSLQGMYLGQYKRALGDHTVLARTVLVRRAPACLQTRYGFTYSSRNAHQKGITFHGFAKEAQENRKLYEYTFGRWIFNETRRLEEICLQFNVAELKKCAAAALNRPASDVKSLHKLAEGDFNRVFEVAMNDGSSIIARLPYHSTVPRRLAVASEVATMDFVRSHSIPAPRILGYSIHENPVGSEYILMEKIQGRPIGDACGSIYYTRDLPSEVPKIHVPGAEHFCVGPFAGLRWWHDKRSNLKVDRGPRETDVDALRVLQAPAEKELVWINSYGRPQFPFERQFSEAFQYQKQDPKTHAESLKRYLQVVPSLTPTNSELNYPVLRHPDIQPNNIFVSDDNRIVSLIDWQHAIALPKFLAAGIPNYFQNYGDTESRSFTPPKLPADINAMEESERAEAYEKYQRRHVHFFYLGFTQRLNGRHWAALEEGTNVLKRRVYDHAGYPWEGLNTPLQLDLVQISQKWPKIAKPDENGTVPPCPISYTKEEMERIDALNDQHRDADGDMEQVNQYLGVASDGWTSHERFESAKEKAKEIREQGLASADDDPWLREMSEFHWPFDDFDENE
ncbi:hypothetical protein BS50DRAFT_604702 [Corynespora cassiicola Philippines]|uniref:Aminoglycoside phosphotransferase domain-containing protein n=1 Tax=Corynespora cassiicola Philippines TaxID=1448308 RepID=A0A2T2N4Q0_CORCC|nr:hypothetical protein BS50DRAFT_604702 [Corynespora cassiicola Philippines]